jgi:hypothetical protein
MNYTDMSKLPFGKKNYQLMVAGIVVLVIGFTIMTLDSQPHGFGFLGLTLGPVIAVAGFVVEVFAILYRPSDR